MIEKLRLAWLTEPDPSLRAWWQVLAFMIYETKPDASLSDYTPEGWK